MKKALIRILCLLLGVNVFTACYGPGPVPEKLPTEEELAAPQAKIDKARQQEELPTEEAETPEQN